MTNITVTHTPRGPEATATLADKFLYWGVPINRFAIRLHQVRRTVGIVRMVVIVLLLVLTFGLFFAHVFLRANIETIITALFWTTPHTSLLSLWIGGVILLYLITRSVRHSLSVNPVQRRGWAREGLIPALVSATTAEAKRFARRNRLDIAKSFSEPVLASLRRAFLRGSDAEHAEVGPIHITRALLEETSIKVLMGRADIGYDQLAGPIDRLLAKQPARDSKNTTQTNEAWFHTLFASYHYAYTHRRARVTPVALLVAAVRTSASRDFLFT
jgi:hypothetical protein